MLSKDVYYAISNQLQMLPTLATTRIISMNDSDPSEKKTDKPYIAIGMKSYTLGELKTDENGVVLDNSREFTAEIQINFYTKFENGTLKCLPLFDKTAKGLLLKDLGFEIVSYKLYETKYRQDMDCLVLESVCTVRGTYKG